MIDPEPRADANPYTPPAETIEADEVQANPSGRQVGGWMVLPMFGMAITAVRLLIGLATDYAPMFASGGDWQVVTDESFADYHPLWAPLILFEIATNLGFVMLIAYSFWLVAKRSKRFVPVVVGYLVAGVVVTTVDVGWASMIPALAEQTTLIGGEIARSMLGAGIWIPYFLVSKRVKETFVNP